MIRRLLPALLLAAVLTGCGTASRSGGTSIQDIRSELDRRACIIGMDDLAFELETIIYYGDFEVADLDSILSTMPEHISCCPGTAQRYEIDRSDGLKLFCPLGHGTVPLIL